MVLTLGSLTILGAICSAWVGADISRDTYYDDLAQVRREVDSNVLALMLQQQTLDLMSLGSPLRLK